MTTPRPRDASIALGRRSYGTEWKAIQVAEAPGRIELLGNHVDYNGGPVLAGAIDRVLAIAAGPGAAPGTLELVAGDVSDAVSTLTVEDCRDWTRSSGPVGPAEYTAGVVAALLARDLTIRDGLQLAITGTVPLGFGMSSSAALCVALVVTVAVDPLSQQDIVVIAREAEHRCGSPVGAMDQSASVAGGIILFEGATTTFTPLTPDLGNYVFAVADSGVHHALGDSSYPVRVDESARALDILRAAVDPGLPALGALPDDLWRTTRERELPGMSTVLRKRVDHVVGEVQRVREGVEAVRSNDWARFGELMTESGRSSNTLYEISHPKVEELVTLLLGQEGVLGARMMGGGEGGPALALIDRDALPAVTGALDAGFFRHNPSSLHGDRLQVCVFGPGARLTHA